MVNLPGVWVAVILLVWFSIVIFFMTRNHLVCKLRIWTVRKWGLEEYFYLPSYDHMLYHFWVPLRKWRKSE